MREIRVNPSVSRRRAIGANLIFRTKGKVGFRAGGSRIVAGEEDDDVPRTKLQRVLRVLREESLLCQLKRRFVVTTGSRHGFRHFPGLPREQAIVRLNQAWVADLTSIRLPTTFCYLAEILDACSRRVVGWELSSRIDTELTLAALEGAPRRVRAWLEPAWLLFDQIAQEVSFRGTRDPVFSAYVRGGYGIPSAARNDDTLATRWYGPSGAEPTAPAAAGPSPSLASCQSAHKRGPDRHRTSARLSGYRSAARASAPSGPARCPGPGRREGPRAG